MVAAKPKIALIPWDPESPAHVERLFYQRIACRWNSEMVESWRDLQRMGKISLQFIVLSSTEPLTSTRLANHTSAYPTEALPIADTACSFGGKQRIPNPDINFIPVGHISLDSTCDDPTECDTYMISSFYISSVLQGNGIGGAAMDVIENMAASEPLNAKTLVLIAGAKENYVMGPKWVALGRDPPTISAQDMYARRGYEVCRRIDNCWSDRDATGKDWSAVAVEMRKNIR